MDFVELNDVGAFVLGLVECIFTLKSLDRAISEQCRIVFVY